MRCPTRYFILRRIMTVQASDSMTLLVGHYSLVMSSCPAVDTMFLTNTGMVHAATLVHDQNRPKIVYRRIPASQIGILSALQGYEFGEAEGGDGASLYEREYLPVLTKAGDRW